MANLRAIRTRIKSVENTRQITKSMKMVAASKLRKTQGAFASLREFAEISGELLADAAGSAAAGGLPDSVKTAGREAEALFRRANAGVRSVCCVLIVGNRGLCGTYNQALLRYCEKLAGERRQSAPAEGTSESGGADSGKPAVSLLVCGRWGKDLIAASGIPVLETAEVSDNPTRDEALQLTEKLKRLYRDGDADEVVLVYQQYRSVLSQTPGSRVLLPLQMLGCDAGTDSAAAPGEEKEDFPGRAGQSNTAPGSTGDMIFEPDRERVVDTLLDMYLVNTVHAALLEARTGEHSARMTAMTAAADNTEELIDKLTLELNHARQAAITTEITEIASGAEALRNAHSGGTI